MYKVYGIIETRTFRVLWMLEELGLPYELVKAPPQSPLIRERNLSGKVPLLETDGTVLTDSTAILTYLADTSGKLTYPAGTLDRARQDALTNKVLDEFDSLVWAASRHSFVLPEEQRVPQVKDTLKWEFTRNLKRLSRSFEGPYLMGETMTIADIILVHCLNWALTAKFQIEDEKMLSYAKALRGREAFRRVAALAG